MRFKFFTAVLVILIISLFTIYPSFNLGLFGDDWLAFFRFREHVDPGFSKSWNYLTYYLTPYGPQDILMGILQKIFNYQSNWYYLLSYIFRLFASFSFYPLVFYLTKNKLASFFAVLFFSITTTGLDTTNWVFNMPSYITIGLFNLFLYFFIKQRERNNLFLLIISALFYYLAYITTPIRMHGSLIFIFLLEFFWVLQERKFIVSKKATIRFVTILGVFLLIRYTGQSQGPPQEPSERFLLGIKAITEMLSQGRFDFIFYPLVMFGSMFVADFISPFTRPVLRLTHLAFGIILPTFLAFFAIIFILVKNYSIPIKRFLVIVLSSEIIWSVIVMITYKLNIITFSDSRLIFLCLLGGYITILTIALTFHYLKQSKTSTSLFLALVWSILSFFFAWWWVPTSIFPTTYRYLIVSAVGVTILLSVFISLGKSRQSRIFLFGFFCSLIILHMITTRIYLSNLVNYHSQEVSHKIWSSMPNFSEIGKSKDPIIIYFEGDGTNGAILHDVITFGFPPHIAILYNLSEKDGGLPVPMDDFKQVVSAITDGKALQAYGYPIKPVPIEKIYAFHLQGKDNLINITPKVREKLKQLKSQ